MEEFRDGPVPAGNRREIRASVVPESQCGECLSTVAVVLVIVYVQDVGGYLNRENKSFTGTVIDWIAQTVLVSGCFVALQRPPEGESLHVMCADMSKS